MTVNGIGSSAALQTQRLVELSRQLDDLNRQLGTGKKSTDYAGLGLDRGLALSLRSQLAAADGFAGTIQSVDTRLQLAATGLAAVDSATHAVKGMTTNSEFILGQSGQTVDQTAARGQLDQVLAVLNTRFGDQYIFSGLSPDQQSVQTSDLILNGDGIRAGLKQTVSERRQADLGDGLGRLVVTAPQPTSVSVAEDAAGSPFGFKLATISSNLTGATVTGPGGSPAAISIDLGGNVPNAGESVTLGLTLPDGTSQTLTLTATTASPPGDGQFSLGATSAATAGNIQAALTTALGKLAKTSLTAASAIAAANDFFAVDAAHPPQRVNGPPFATATALVGGTSANTVLWYAGEAGPTPARSTASARVDSSMQVQYGLRANEQGLRSAVASIAVMAAVSFDPADANAQACYKELTARLNTNLEGQQGTQKVSDIAAEIAYARNAVNDAKSRQQQTSAALTDMLKSIEDVPPEQTGVQFLAVQTSLQASLQTTAILAKLSLVNYLS